MPGRAQLSRGRRWRKAKTTSPSCASSRRSTSTACPRAPPTAATGESPRRRRRLSVGLPWWAVRDRQSHHPLPDLTGAAEQSRCQVLRMRRESSSSSCCTRGTGRGATLQGERRRWRAGLAWLFLPPLEPRSGSWTSRPGAAECASQPGAAWPSLSWRTRTRVRSRRRPPGGLRGSPGDPSGATCLPGHSSPPPGELFAQATVDQFPGIAVESVTDSSRYFVLRIEDGNGMDGMVWVLPS